MHALLFALPAREVVTTNYDTLFEKASEAIDTLAAVKRVPADRAFDLFYLGAVAGAELGRFDAAKADADKAAQYATSPAEKERATNLVKAIDDYRTRKAEADRAIRDANVGNLAATGAASPEPAAPGPAPNTAVPSGIRPFQTVAQGRLRNMVCAPDQSPILEIAIEAGTLRLLVDKPEQIKIEGVGAATIDLACGAQDRQVRVGYEPAVNAARKTVGNVRLLDFGK